ncbi:hypothetical protein BBJ28_00003435 [Nothophytophthora sp. Chile5]|nr:hypothetical protein BBJ28_00003435 [Nothophytophthora sp. Chile5]
MMKAVFASLAFTAIAVVHAADCDVAALSAVAATSDASTCQSTSTFAVPVNSTEGSILASYDAFCASEACLEVLEALDAIKECTIDGTALHASIVHPIEDACSASTATSGHEAHESSMAEDSSEEVSASAEMEMEDSHEAMSSTSAAEEAGDSDDDTDSHDVASSNSTSSVASSNSSSNATATEAPAAASSASAISVAAGSVFLAAAALLF